MVKLLVEVLNYNEICELRFKSLKLSLADNAGNFYDCIVVSLIQVLAEPVSEKLDVK